MVVFNDQVQIFLTISVHETARAGSSPSLEKGISMTLDCSQSVLPNIPVQYSWVPPHLFTGMPSKPLFAGCLERGMGGYLQYLTHIVHPTNFH